MSLVNKLSKRIYDSRSYWLFHRDLTEIPGLESRASFRLAVSDDISRLTWEEHHYDDARRADAIESIRNGNLLVIGELEGKIVHSTWISFDQIVFPPTSFQLGKGWAYLSGTRTVAGFDASSLYKAGYAFSLELAHEIGAVSVLGIAYEHSQLSLDSFDSLGFEKLAYMSRQRWFTKWWVEKDPALMRQYLLDEPVAAYPEWAFSKQAV